MMHRSSMTAPYLWMLCISALVLSMLFWDSTLMLALCMLLFGVLYDGFNWRIVRFKKPKWLVFRSAQGEASSGEPH